MKKVFFIYAGRRGSNLECAIALHEIARREGLDSGLILSQDNDRREKVMRLYPEALFADFFSPGGILALRRKLYGSAAFFTMLSPKMLPLLLSLPAGKVFYFHSTYDYGEAAKGLREKYYDLLHDVAIRSASLAAATQMPLAAQIRERLGVEAEVLPHPPYSPIKPAFFSEDEPAGIPFGKGDYFLAFGEVARPSKGTRLLLDAAAGSVVKVVLAGRYPGKTGGKNVFHINRWVSDGQLHRLIMGCKCVVLPYLLQSQFSGCLALAFHFRKPVLAPDSPAFEGLVKEGRTGWLFRRADAADLRRKMELVASGRARHSQKAIARKEKEMEGKTADALRRIMERLGKEA